VNKSAIVIGAAAFVVMVVCICSNVVVRYFFRLSFDWAEETAYLCFNWAVFLGITVVYHSKGMVAIDMLVNRLPPKARRVVMLFNYLLVILICATLISVGIRFSLNGWIRKSSAIGIRYFFYDMAIPVSSAIIGGYSVKFFVQTLLGETK